MARGAQRRISVSFRVTPAENLALKAAAKAVKLTRSEWLRTTALDAAGAT
jgi:uncharacterized protein (DUF1778 family)